MGTMLTVNRYEALADTCTELSVGIDRGLTWARAGVIRTSEIDGCCYVTTREADRMIRLGVERLDEFTANRTSDRNA